MTEKNKSKFDLKKRVFGWFFAVIMSFLGLASLPLSVVYAEPIAGASGSNGTTPEGTQQSSSTDGEASQFKSESALTISYKKLEQDCTDHLGSMSWLICSATEKIAEATDWLYDRIQGVLEINPISMNEDSPIFNIWKYCQGITNIIFIIFFLVVIYSQITGYGISNYGIKQSLPKLIVAAVLINLSFLICSLAVDLSNIVGNGLRGAFMKVQEQAIVKEVVVDEEEAPVEVVEEDYSDEEKQRRSEQTTFEMLKSAFGFKEEGPDYTAEQKQEYSVTAETPLGSKGRALIGGTALVAIIGTVVYESGAIWMLIPVALGGIVSVATGLITISLRQAVVTLLIMISPLAIVACILPNTESLFKKWLDLLKKMLIFYPMFSLLFGVSSLAGFAIVASAKDGFGVLLGTAVQIFPLFFSWSLMKMSGTFLADINAKMHAWAEKPLAANKAWAESHLENRRARMMANGLTPSAKLRQYLADRKIAREEETQEMQAAAKLRGQAYAANRNYHRNGTPTREGEEAYERQARSMAYQKDIERHKNNMNKGLGQLEAVKARASVAQRERLDRLDQANVVAADELKIERARSEKIEFENARGFHNRMENAIDVHFDDLNGDRDTYKMHSMRNGEDRDVARARYSSIRDIMENDVQGIHYAAATAAQGFDTKKKLIETNMQHYFNYTAPTKDIEYRLGELTKGKDAIANVDSIIAGLRILNQRGDTDLVKEQMEYLLDHKVRLGTHASQALANFLMFEVKDSDPWLRRFGKYINLETANAFNENKRKVMDVTYDEYVRGYHYEPDPDHPGRVKRVYAKRGMEELLQGTSLDSIERTALSSYDDSLIKAYTGPDGRLDFEGYMKKRSNIDKAFGPAFISANLKYLSGSEQISNAVRSKTGYEAVQNPNDGTYTMKPFWEKDKYRRVFAGHVQDLKKWYQESTLKYLEDQTPTQILGLRSDYRIPLEKHLEETYRDADTSEWTEEAKTEHDEIMNEWSELQTRYGDLSTEDAREQYEREAAIIKKKMVGAQFRQLLDSKGKLNQIYRTRRSGAANNAKDWVRDWLDLDNELKITMKLDDDRRKLKREFEEMRRERNRRRGLPDGDTDATDSEGTVYSDDDRAFFVNNIEDLWNDLKDEDEGAFYSESMEYLKENLGEDSFIAEQYKKFREDDPYADGYMLKEYLTDLLREPDNY